MVTTRLFTIKHEWNDSVCIYGGARVPAFPYEYKSRSVINIYSSRIILTNTNQDQLLTSIHHVLADNGIFIFDTRFPSKEELIQPSTEEYWTTISDEKGRKCDLYTEMTYDSIQQIQHYITTRRFYEGDTLVEEIKTTIDLRYTYPQELERLLVANGFELLHIYNDWEGNELGEDCYSMVVVCRKKK